MLRQRVATATILGSIAIGLALALPISGFALVFSGILLFSAWEWAALTGYAKRRARVPYSALLLALLGALLPIADYRDWTFIFLMPVMVAWCVVPIWLYLFTKAPGRVHAPWATGLSGIVFLSGFWVSLLGLRAQFGIDDVLFLLCLIWGADSAAYFVGRRFGRRKLAPLISPGKTWEGVWGELTATIVIACIGALFLKHTHTFFFVGLCVASMAFSVVGDLFESMLKRQRRVKDSGALLPGHGGMLDRIDGLIAAAPVYLLGLYGMSP